MDATLALRMPQDLRDWLRAEAVRRSDFHGIPVTESIVARHILDTARRKSQATARAVAEKKATEKAEKKVRR